MNVGPIRYALIGAGSAARTHLASVLNRRHVLLVGIFDPAPKTAWRIAPEFCVGPDFSSAAELLAVTKPDVVSICTPPLHHHQIALLALSAGAHVICEKPMAMSVHEAEEMEAARSNSNKLGAINFSYRGVPNFQYARHLIASSALGRVTRVTLGYLQSFMAAQEVSWTWRHDVRIAGFGALGDLGVHMIDALRFITGLEFHRVTGTTGRLITKRRDRAGLARDVTTDSHAMFIAELSSGVSGLFEATQVAAGFGDLFRIEISGENGTIALDSEHPAEIRAAIAKSPSKSAIWHTNMPSVPVPSEFLAEMTAIGPGSIIDALSGGAADYGTFADGLAAQRVLAALTQSVESGSWTPVR